MSHYNASSHVSLQRIMQQHQSCLYINNINHMYMNMKNKVKRTRGGEAVTRGGGRKRRSSKGRYLAKLLSLCAEVRRCHALCFGVGLAALVVWCSHEPLMLYRRIPYQQAITPYRRIPYQQAITPYHRIPYQQAITPYHRIPYQQAITPYQRKPI
jgi:hypothetical protein